MALLAEAYENGKRPDHLIWIAPYGMDGIRKSSSEKITGNFR